MTTTTKAPAKAKKSADSRRGFLPEPRNAEQLLVLSPCDIRRLYCDTVIRMGRVRRHRGFLLSSPALDHPALSLVNGEIAKLGSLLCVLQERRAFHRARRRQALGRVPERAEAIARAVDTLLPDAVHKRIQDEADRFVAQAAADLAADLPAEPRP